MRYVFGEFEIDIPGGQLIGPDGPVVVRRQAWNLLVALVEAAPALVSRDDLLDRVWGRSALSPNALPQTISELRQVLGDSARTPRYIETCHGRGYRMACTVSLLDPPQPRAGQALLADPPPKYRSPMVIGLALAAAAALAVVLWPRMETPGPQGTTAAEPAGTEALRRQAAAARQRHDPAALAAQLRALSLVEPGNVDVMLDLAEAELDALQTEQARQTLRLLGAQATTRQEPRWLVLNARLSDIDGDSEQALHLAEAALTQAMALNEAESVADAAELLSGLRLRSGDLAAALAVLSDQETLAVLADDREQRGRLALASIAVHRGQGQVDAAREELDALQLDELSAALVDRAEIERALLLVLDGQPSQAWDRLQNLLEADSTRAHPDFVIDLHNAIGSVGVEVGAFDEAMAAFEHAMSVARGSGRGQRVAGIQVNAGALMARRDRFVEAERLWQGSLEVFEQLGDRRGQAVVLGNLAAAASAQGLNERSQALNQRALEIFRDLELDGPRARTAFNLALVAAREGDLGGAEALFAEAYEGYQRLGQADLMLHVGASRLDYLVLAGDLLLAEALLLELEELLARGSVLRQAAVHASAGRLALWRGELEHSRQAFEKARMLRVESGHDSWVATSKLELLQIDLLAGANPWQVRVAAAELAEQFERRGQTRAAARSRLLMVEALLSEGQTSQAAVELARLRDNAARFTDASLALDLDWVEVWTAREEERLPRLEALARKAARQGFLGKLAQIAASVEARGIAMAFDQPSLADTSTPLVVVLPPYVAGP